MKKIQVVTVFLLLILCGFSSCKNENIDVSLPVEATASEKKLAFDPKPNKNDDVYAKLRDFKEKLRLFEENASLRSVQTMPVDQVVWNVEAYLNAAYGHTDKSFTGQSIRRDSFLIPMTTGEVTGNVVLSALANAKGLVIDQYRSITEQGKHIVFIDITSKNIGANQLRIIVSSFIGLNPVQSRIDPYTSLVLLFGCFV